MDGTISPSVGDNDLPGVHAQPWQFAYRQALSPYILRRMLIAVGLYAVAYTAICPLGANELPWNQRLAYVALSSVLCAPVFHAEYVVTLYLTRFWSPFHIALAVVATTLVAAPTCTAIVFGVDTLFRANLRSYGLATTWLFMTVSVMSCSAVIHYLVNQRVKNESCRGPERDTADKPGSPPAPDTSVGSVATAAAQAAEPPSKFLDRLPVEVGRDVIYLKMSDHYVEVVTTLGQCAILMRFADAVAELGDRGLRIHRSYWVAYPHVEGWRRHNQRTLVQLTGGHMAPVSRTYLGNVRAALMRGSPRVTGRPRAEGR